MRTVALAILLLLVADDNAGYVDDLRGAVYLQAAGAAKPILLSRERDVMRLLRAGDRLRCDPGGFARLRIGDEMQELKPSKTWFVVQPTWRSGVRRDIRAAIVEYGRIGGRAKGLPPSGIRLYEPSEGAAAVPSTFAIRWNSAAEDCGLSLSIRTMGRKELWSHKGVPASAGSYTSATLKAALARQRESKELLELVLSGSCVDEQRIRFGTLTADEEESLNKELVEWNDPEDEMLTMLGRAAVFAGYRMFNEVALEYEKALRIAPRSRSLLTRTIAAHDRTGNAERVRELAERLNHF